MQCNTGVRRCQQLPHAGMKRDIWGGGGIPRCPELAAKKRGKNGACACLQAVRQVYEITDWAGDSAGAGGGGGGEREGVVGTAADERSGCRMVFVGRHLDEAGLGSSLEEALGLAAAAAAADGPGAAGGDGGGAAGDPHATSRKAVVYSA